MNPTPQSLHRQADGVSVWRPEKLDVDTLVDRFGQSVAERVLWLGYSVYTGLANDARCRDAGRVPLSTAHLRAVVGRHHLGAVRDAALHAGYVDRARSYRAGDRSQTYWILPPYDSARLVRREITDSGLRQNVRTWREERRRETWKRIHCNETPVEAAVCVHLWRNLRRVGIDAAIDLGNGFPPAHQVAIERIRERDLWFNVDDYGRIHTNLTNLAKSLRQYLAVDGNTLTNVDISESQPLFIGLAIAASHWKQTTPRQGQRRTDTSSDAPSLPSLMLDNTMLDKDPLLEGSLDRKRLPSDLRHYIDLCEARGLYRAVAERLGRTRDDAKKAVMTVYIGKPWHRNAASAVLDDLFPSVMTTMRQIKRNDYRRLAHFAQGVESAFMYRRVVPRTMAQRPSLWISTIHDSVLCPAGDGEWVRQVMLDEFAKLGLRPQVKVEPC